jgi:sRNA-binding carbon storage regulator CsrA
LGIKAPKNVTVDREEVAQRKQTERNARWPEYVRER